MNTEIVSGHTNTYYKLGQKITILYDHCDNHELRVSLSSYGDHDDRKFSDLSFGLPEIVRRTYGKHGDGV